MARILVLYYSSYGHIAQMADAVAEGVRQAGHECDVRRVPETAPPEVAKAAGFVADHSHELISGIDALPQYDGLVIGAPTRFGRMPSQMAAFLDQAGGLWYTDALVGKAAAAFTSTAAQHGGQETTLVSMMLPIMHHGMLMVGLPYSEPELTSTTSGGTPYGASHVAGSADDRDITEEERKLCIALGRRLAETALKLSA